jgi:hypothetical protein
MASNITGKANVAVDRVNFSVRELAARARENPEHFIKLAKEMRGG